MSEFSTEFETALTTPHEHEHSEYRKPLWLLWKMEKGSDGLISFPVLDSVCDNESSARYHLFALLETKNMSSITNMQIFVERIPANHRFASSLIEVFDDTFFSVLEQASKPRLPVKSSKYYPHEGD